MPFLLLPQASTAPVGFEWMPILVAMLVGGAIGFEREIHGRPAGLRTHVLVCLASSLLIFASRVIPPTVLVSSEAGRIVMDPNRLAAGIVTGIGFLGAATVIRAGDMVRGLTTGATVWTVAGLGVVIGQGEYTLAIVGAGTVLVILVGLDRISRRIAPVIYRRLTIRGAGAELPGLSARIVDVLTAHDIRVQDLSGHRGATGEPFELVFHVRCRNVRQAPEMLDKLARVEGVSRVQWSEIAH